MELKSRSQRTISTRRRWRRISIPTSTSVSTNSLPAVARSNGNRPQKHIRCSRHRAPSTPPTPRGPKKQAQRLQRLQRGAILAQRMSVSRRGRKSGMTVCARCLGIFLKNRLSENKNWNKSLKNLPGPRAGWASTPRNFLVSGLHREGRAVRELASFSISMLGI